MASASRPKTNRHVIGILVGVAILVGLIVRATRLARADPPAMDWGLFVWFLVPLVVEWGARVARWFHLYHGVPLRLSATVLLVGMGLNTIAPPGGSELGRAALAKREADIPSAKTIAAAGLERFLDAAALVAVAGVGVVAWGLAFQHPRLWTLAAVVMVGIGVLVWLTLHPARLHRAPEGSLRHRVLSWVSEILVDVGQILRVPSRSVRLVWWTAVIWGAQFAGLWIFLQAMGADLAVSTVAIAYSLGLLVGGASLVPGGIGVREATTSAVLVAHGGGEGAVLTVIVLHRLLMDSISLSLAGISVGLLTTDGRRSLRSAWKEPAPEDTT